VDPSECRRIHTTEGSELLSPQDAGSRWQRKEPWHEVPSSETLCPENTIVDDVVLRDDGSFEFKVCTNSALASPQIVEDAPSSSRSGGKLMKAVAQLDYGTEEVLFVHGSISLAAGHVGAKSIKGISDCCNGRSQSSFGYKWRQASPAEAKEFEALPRNELYLTKAVAQLDYDTEEVLFVHGSMTLAAGHVGAKSIKGINDCCNGRQQSSSSYKWRRAEPGEVDVARAAHTGLGSPGARTAHTATPSQEKSAPCCPENTIIDAIVLRSDGSFEFTTFLANDNSKTFPLQSSSIPESSNAKRRTALPFPPSSLLKYTFFFICY
jgi:hypothetical protein